MTSVLAYRPENQTKPEQFPFCIAALELVLFPLVQTTNNKTHAHELSSVCKIPRHKLECEAWWWEREVCVSVWYQPHSENLNPLMCTWNHPSLASATATTTDKQWFPWAQLQHTHQQTTPNHNISVVHCSSTKTSADNKLQMHMSKVGPKAR